MTAGYQAQEVKRNMQIPEGSPVSVALGEMVLTGLARSPLFMSAALPLRVFPPMFNSYSGGQTFGTHVDTAIRQMASTGQRIRTDLSATLFLTAPEEYDGGELVVEDSYGTHSVKLPAGAYGAVSGDEPAPGDSGDAGSAGLELLLDSEHGEGRCAADAAVRPGLGDSEAGGGERRPDGEGAGGFS